MKRILSTMVAVALLAAVAFAARQARGEEKGPVIVVSFAGYEPLLNNANVLGDLAGQPQLGVMLDSLVTLGTGGRGLTGLDKTKPWGLAVYADEEGQYPVQGFIPATDLKQLLRVLPPPPGSKGPLKPDADGVYEIENPQGQAVYAAQKGGWAVLADSRENLKPRAANPAALFGKLAKNYLLAVQVSVKNVPAATREQLLAQAKMLIDLVTQQKSDESDEQFAQRSAMTKKGFEQFGTLCKDLDSLTLGLNIDPHTKTVNLDMEMTALAGTKTARQLAGEATVKTNLAGFLLPGAAVTAISAGTGSDADVADAKSTLGNFATAAVTAIDAKEEWSKEKKALLKQSLADLMDVLNKTLDTKKQDSGMALLLDREPTFVAGAAVAEGGKLEKAFKRLVSGEPKLAKLFKLDAERYQGVRVHVATVPVDNEQAASLVGKQVEIVAGFGKDVFYIGVGNRALKTLKQVIDDSKKSPGKSVPTFQIAVGGETIAKFAAQVAPNEDDKAKFRKMATVLAKSKGKDHIVLTLTSVPNGAKLRLTAEEGIAKAIVAIGKEANAKVAKDQADTDSSEN